MVRGASDFSENNDWRKHSTSFLVIVVLFDGSHLWNAFHAACCDCIYFGRSVVTIWGGRDARRARRRKEMQSIWRRSLTCGRHGLHRRSGMVLCAGVGVLSSVAVGVVVSVWLGPMGQSAPTVPESCGWGGLVRVSCWLVERRRCCRMRFSQYRDSRRLLHMGVGMVIPTVEVDGWLLKPWYLLGVDLPISELLGRHSWVVSTLCWLVRGNSTHLRLHSVLSECAEGAWLFSCPPCNLGVILVLLWELLTLSSVVWGYTWPSRCRYILRGGTLTAGRIEWRGVLLVVLVCWCGLPCLWGSTSL